MFSNTFRNDYWETIDESRKRKEIKKLLMELPEEFKLIDMTQTINPKRLASLGLLEYKGSLFRLIPGADVVLGWDSTRRIDLTLRQRESWNDSKIEYGLNGNFEEFLSTITTKQRQVSFAPMIVEVLPYEVGLINTTKTIISNKELQNNSAIKTIIVDKDEKTLIYADGVTESYRILNSHDSIIRHITKGGFSIPNVDQWEYLCGCGLQSVFRWGDYCPSTSYPTDVKIVDDIGQPWKLHKSMNFFGLHIAENPYELEIVKEESRFKGGDGGSMICGGAGFLLGWLSLATSFEGTNHGNYHECVGRRVLIVE